MQSMTRHWCVLKREREREPVDDHTECLLEENNLE